MEGIALRDSNCNIPGALRDDKTERDAVWSVAMQWCMSRDLEAHTSGSTGVPKPIHLPIGMVCESARRTIGFFGLTARSHIHSCVSARFIGGKMMVVRALEAGCGFSYEIPSNRPELATLSRIDLLAVVPSMMWHILKRKEEGTLPDVRNIIVGGAPVPEPLRQAIASSGLKVYETYGMTETASHIALRRIESIERPFIPLPGIDISLDSRGCLVIDINSGREKPITTNDLARVYVRGRFMILGRADNMIITGGRKVSPENIERRIAHLIQGEFIITSRPSDKWGREIVLHAPSLGDTGVMNGVDSQPIYKPIPEHLSRAMARILSSHERPRALITSPLSHTPNGKIIRHPL